jgi:hypothetical protein
MEYVFNKSLSASGTLAAASESYMALSLASRQQRCQIDIRLLCSKRQTLCLFLLLPHRRKTRKWPLQERGQCAPLDDYAEMNRTFCGLARGRSGRFAE